VLYFFDRQGVVQRRVFVSNVSNVDWEDLTISPDGRIFIGDFGNNDHKRKDLKIYALPSISSWQSDTIHADTIRFTYQNQSAFPPPSSERDYDCEAMVYCNDSLFIFSKNWTSPYTGYVKMYAMPASSGSYSLQVLDSVKLGTVKEFSWVTSADIVTDQLYLLGYGSAWRFDVSEKMNLAKPIVVPLNHFSQKEATSGHGSNLYITDESLGGFGNLYSLDIKLGSTELVGKPQVEVGHSDDYVLIRSTEPMRMVRLHSLAGDMRHRADVGDKFAYKLDKKSPEIILSDGFYVLTIELSDGKVVTRKLLFTRE
jgi:hypothetical protein